MNVTDDDLDHLYTKLQEVLGYRAAATMMELLAENWLPVRVWWNASPGRRMATV